MARCVGGWCDEVYVGVAWDLSCDLGERGPDHFGESHALAREMSKCPF
jgi:hypothetical protein